MEKRDWTILLYIAIWSDYSGMPWDAKNLMMMMSPPQGALSHTCLYCFAHGKARNSWGIAPAKREFVGNRACNRMGPYNKPTTQPTDTNTKSDKLRKTKTSMIRLMNNLII